MKRAKLWRSTSTFKPTDLASSMRSQAMQLSSVQGAVQRVLDAFPTNGEPHQVVSTTGDETQVRCRRVLVVPVGHTGQVPGIVGELGAAQIDPPIGPADLARHRVRLSFNQAVRGGRPAPHEGSGRFFHIGRGRMARKARRGRIIWDTALYLTDEARGMMRFSAG